MARTTTTRIEPKQVLGRWVRAQDLGRMRLRRPIALINGAFDLLHLGHMALVRAARHQSSTVVCALDSDDKVSTKGVGRPIMLWPERASALGFMGVDIFVEIDNDADMETLIRHLAPDFRVLGNDYMGRHTRFPSVPRRYIHRAEDGWAMSTSEVIERCKRCK